MVDRSLLSVGDMTRMADVFQKAQNGEDITVAYIGGSITEGYNAGNHGVLCQDLHRPASGLLPGYHCYRR